MVIHIEEFEKFKISDFEVTESAEEIAKHIEKVISEGADTFETKHRTKSGETQDVLVSSRAISIGGNNFVQSICRDITEHKRFEEELKNSREYLRNLSMHLQSVREEERTRIAREIHDELGQALTALKIDLSWLNNKLPEERKSLLEKTGSMLKLIDSTIQTVRRISSELRPGILDDFGLAAAIEWQAEEFQNRTGIKCEVNLEPEDIIFDQALSTTIFRIFQEAMTNVARHANATRVKVNLKEEAGMLALEVKDNGKGITEEQISSPQSFGLIGIRERAYSFEGEVKISGIPDKGTTVTVIIPLDKNSSLGKSEA